MGDTADFERLVEMEARLSRALDRIAAGMAAGTGGGADAVDATALADADAARQDAEARAAELAERVTALEERLAETQETLSEAQNEVATARGEADAAIAAAQAEVAAAQEAAKAPGSEAAALAALEQRLASAEASRGAAQAELTERTEELAEKDAALAEMQAALEAAQAEAEDIIGAEPAAEAEDMEKALAVMGRRVERARAERDQARMACDAATDALDELREATGANVDDRILVLRRQLRLMRTRAEDLAAQLSLLQSGAGVDASILDQGLLAEVQTLRQLRDTDAAELERIVQEMQAGLDLAQGGSHA